MCKSKHVSENVEECRSFVSSTDLGQVPEANKWLVYHSVSHGVPGT